MNKDSKWEIKNGILGLLLLPLFLVCFTFETLAQKKRDHIVLQDSAYIEGYIKLNSSNPFESLFFKKRKKESYQNYNIQEVSEFYENHRSYQRKTFDYQNQTVTVFLEKLVYDYPEVSVFKWLDNRHTFFLETENGIQKLGEGFREELSRELANPSLSPLLEITNLNYGNLSYLLNVANSSDQPMTFSRFFRVTPQVGIISSKQSIKIPNQNKSGITKGNGTSLSLNFEIFPTYKRNISINFSPSYSIGKSSGFFAYQEGDSRFETDLYFDFSSIHLPAQIRYYLEIQPNKFRAFLEAGYGLDLMKAKDGMLDIAEIKGQFISTDSEFIDPSSDFKGIITGLGIEKYMRKTKALTFGISYSSKKNSTTEKYSYFKPYLGFKF